MLTERLALRKQPESECVFGKNSVCVCEMEIWLDKFSNVIIIIYFFLLAYEVVMHVWDGWNLQKH